MVREMFNRETGRDATVEQLRKLFGRMKDKVKKNHDEKRLKLYEKSCKLTGGGPGPHPLEDEDGDMVGENPTGFEPIDTPFKFSIHSQNFHTVTAFRGDTKLDSASSKQ